MPSFAKDPQLRRFLPWGFLLTGILILVVRGCSFTEFESGQHSYLFDRGGQKFPYLLYLPESYQPDRKLPLLVYLHGASLRGHRIERVKQYGPTRWVDNRKDFPMAVLSPQCFPEADWSDMTWVPHLIDYITAELGLDEDRIYLTGISLGGSGAWHFAARNPERFAAVAPLCGYGNPKDAEHLRDIPVWVFHGEKDRVVPLSASSRMVDAVRRAGGNITFTVLPNAGHSIVKEVYYQDQLYDWLLEQRR